ncbi:hypothetical protein PCYB_132080 [Plasmodium cynomolgi strain B]|uniref:Peripheral plastid protein 1 n=1 Tax=Plasmodium cynomolgi (strain B) TaxID=1120755 RepID=K6UM65_PLACD|nr:hypothetical protein PCYB_132080 [Plasmodium cynomolgi strain B]GAB68333.1 hypothetical protein PCYB_132080 [Plasmodium cynomolgi strain B]
MLFLIKNLIGCTLLLLVVNTHLHVISHKWQKGLKGGRVLSGIKTHSCVHPNRHKWPYNRNKNCKPKSYLYIQNKKRKNRQAYKLNSESEGCIELSNLESNPKEALKNVIEYKKHLENFKSKGIDKKDNLRNFVLYILSDFEQKYHKHTHLADVQNMRNEKVKEEYLQSNYNCFLDIVKTIEENLYNILLYKIQSIKLKALDDIKETVLLSHRESNADYISYVNHVNKTFEEYEKKLQNLFPSSFKFSLYDKMSRNSGLVEEEQQEQGQQLSSLSNFVYHFPMEKYEQLIKKNINYTINKSKLKFYKNNLSKTWKAFLEIAYRIPDTNLNISTQYVKGKFNVKLNCIPDDSLHLLGSYGFVKALPFGNLGLSFSMNF